jgi:hypothetical protein
MTDFATAGWTVGIAAWLALALYACWIAWRVWKDRLMRCPETGSITLVGIEPASRRAGKAPEVKVQRCGLWPEKMDCARGCLARYGETSPGYRVNLDALRPFKPR